LVRELCQSDIDKQAEPARWPLATVAFAILMIVASTTSDLVIVHPKMRIIPIFLGIFGYTYGSLLGVFLCGDVHQTSRQQSWQHHRHDRRLHRRRDLNGLPNGIANIFGTQLYRSRPSCRQ
jgi:SSS family solute:Na+ symporter